MNATSPTKVAFRIPGDDGTFDVETLWATRVGPDRYELDNSPFLAYSVSWRDVVLAPQDQDGMATFQSVVAKSGHRTLRVMLDPPFEEGNVSALEMEKLVGLGCSFEGSRSELMSVDVPPEVNLYAIRAHLISSGLQWEHADPTYYELFPEEAPDA